MSSLLEIQLEFCTDHIKKNYPEEWNKIKDSIDDIGTVEEKLQLCKSTLKKVRGSTKPKFNKSPESKYVNLLSLQEFTLAPSARNALKQTNIRLGSGAAKKTSKKRTMSKKKKQRKSTKGKKARGKNTVKRSLKKRSMRKSRRNK